MRTTLSSLPWFALTALIFFAPPAPGQDTATLTGTIRDQSGASIPAAAGFLRAPIVSGQSPFENKYVNTSSGNVEVIGETAGLGTQGRKSWRQIQ